VLNAVNYAEVIQKLAQHGHPAPVEAADVVRSLGATVLAVNADDAVRAAQMWSATRSAGLSLGDRFCLAVAAGVPNGRAVTADRCWTTVDVGVPVDLIH
jgi:ribonuclease VapC